MDDAPPPTVVTKQKLYRVKTIAKRTHMKKVVTNDKTRVKLN